MIRYESVRYRPIIPHAALEELSMQKYMMAIKKLSLDDKNHSSKFHLSE